MHVKTEKFIFVSEKKKMKRRKWNILWWNWKRSSKDKKTIGFFFLSVNLCVFAHTTSIYLALNVSFCMWICLVNQKTLRYFALIYRTINSSHWLSVNITTTTFHLLLKQNGTHTHTHTHINYKYLYILNTYTSTSKKKKHTHTHFVMELYIIDDIAFYIDALLLLKHWNWTCGLLWIIQTTRQVSIGMKKEIECNSTVYSVLLLAGKYFPDNEDECRAGEMRRNEDKCTHAEQIKQNNHAKTTANKISTIQPTNEHSQLNNFIFFLRKRRENERFPRQSKWSLVDRKTTMTDKTLYIIHTYTSNGILLNCFVSFSISH